MQCEVLDLVAERIGVLSTELAHIRLIVDSAPSGVDRDLDAALDAMRMELDSLMLLLVSLVPTTDH